MITTTCDYCTQEIEGAASGAPYFTFTTVVPQGGGANTTVRIDLHNECVDPFTTAVVAIKGERPGSPAGPTAETTQAGPPTRNLPPGRPQGGS